MDNIDFPLIAKAIDVDTFVSMLNKEDKDLAAKLNVIDENYNAEKEEQKASADPERGGLQNFDNLDENVKLRMNSGFEESQ